MAASTQARCRNTRGGLAAFVLKLGGARWFAGARVVSGPSPMLGRRRSRPSRLVPAAFR